jgi:hypothetical protein
MDAVAKVGVMIGNYMDIIPIYHGHLSIADPAASKTSTSIIQEVATTL